ncbi:MAG TPA: hypothetical protein VII64_05360 [Thermodesulfobacteriota bacterium]
MKNTVIAAFFIVMAPLDALAYPNGTPNYVTDTGPFCASCHSAAKIEYMPEMTADLARGEVAETKHYGAVKAAAPPSPYMELSSKQKEEIIRVARLIDSKSSVSLSAPGRVKAGQDLTVTVQARGGNGPAIGVMLVDRALRFQARPISSSGWHISGPPEVRGQDGKAQTIWIDRRYKGLLRNLNYVMIEEQAFDLEKDILPGASVTFTLKAPSRPGAYTMAAALLYGTENTEKAGFFQRSSGRILFSDELEITVENP